MIAHNLHEWRTADDAMYVQGHRVLAVYRGTTKFYPEEETDPPVLTSGRTGDTFPRGPAVQTTRPPE